ncbi:MAG: YraN family protein [Planctomycetota bacterium]
MGILWIKRLLDRLRAAPPEDPKSWGASGEDEAAKRLHKKGYKILERNVRFSHGEIDIVALDGPVLCFVEVKSRRSARFGPAALAVTPAKQRKIKKLAEAYILKHRLRNINCRFDVVTVEQQDGQTVVDIIPDAFRCDPR